MDELFLTILKGDYSGKLMVSVKETAGLLGISDRTIYNRTHRNATKSFPIPHKRVLGTIRFDLRDILSYIDSL